MTEQFKDKRFEGKVDGFDTPTQLPKDEREASAWQAANKRWWESSPMRYDWRTEIEAEAGSKEYFDEVDRRFFGSVSHYMPWVNRPFDTLIDFEGLSKLDVLEIGVGQGSHAELIAPHCKSFTGVDLTDYASGMTKKRLQLRCIAADIRKMDAESMGFPDSSFDFIWSWGVIHHSANTLAILQEMKRVLRPKGRAVVMVYHRSPWKYYVMDGMIKGVLYGEIFKSGGLHRVSQSQTDGAIARYYRPDEWRRLCDDLFEVACIKITGHKTDVIPLPAGRPKDWVVSVMPDSFSRLITDKLKFGSFLIAELVRLD